MSGEALVLLGQLLGISLACGLNLYATVAVLGLLSRVGLLAELPTGLQGLEGLLVIGSAAALYLVEAVVDKVPHVDSLWDTVHTFIRPPAAALLAVGLLWGMPVHIVAAGAGFALTVALAAHGTKAGLRLTLNTGGQPRRTVLLSIAEDVAAIGLAVAALQRPPIALGVAAALLLLLVVFGPRLWRALHLGMLALGATLRRVFGAGGWRDYDQLPRDLRALLDPHPLGTAPPRGTRATVNGLRAAGAYRNGWLVVTRRGPVFLYRTMFGGRRLDLPPIRDYEVRRGVWADVVAIAGDSPYTLFLLKDGPPAELCLNEAALSPA